MCWNLYYLKVIDNEKRLEFERKFEEGELGLIHECNQILGNFNSFSDYYSMLNNSIQELKEYILEVENLKNKFSPIMKKNIIIEINRKFINFASMFKIFLDYYEVQVKQIYGVESKEAKEFKKKCSKIFDTNFEYRFLYHLRHYCVHYKLPITKINENIEDKRRIFYIEKERLKNWEGWKQIIKSDIQNLNEDIDVKLFILKIEKILKKFNKEISYFNTSEVLGAIKIMKRYVRTNENPYIVKQIKDKQGNSKFKIQNMIDDYFFATGNILKLGIISCAVYNKEYGLQFFDPYNMIFTKEEKERFGLE